MEIVCRPTSVESICGHRPTAAGPTSDVSNPT